MKISILYSIGTRKINVKEFYITPDTGPWAITVIRANNTHKPTMFPSTYYCVLNLKYFKTITIFFLRFELLLNK